MQLEDLCGQHVLSGIEIGRTEKEDRYYGTFALNYVKFTLDGVHYKSYEDPEDGWRSRCEELVLDDTPCKVKIPDTEVLCFMSDNPADDILIIKDIVTGETVLEIGTASKRDWYPRCVMNYFPGNLSCNVGRGEGNNDD